MKSTANLKLNWKTILLHLIINVCSNCFSTLHIEWKTVCCVTERSVENGAMDEDNMNGVICNLAELFMVFCLNRKIKSLYGFHDLFWD